jgi:RecA-family ATPase
MRNDAQPPQPEREKMQNNDDEAKRAKFREAMGATATRTGGPEGKKGTHRAGKGHAKRKGAQWRKSGLNSQQPPLSSWFKAHRVEDLPDLEPPQLIKGLLYAGQKMSVTGGSKKFKSGMILQAGFCVANGLPFLDEHETTKSKVAFIDFELQGWSVRKRLERIRNALQAEGLNGNFDNITIYPLRGKSRLFKPRFRGYLR